MSDLTRHCVQLAAYHTSTRAEAASRLGVTDLTAVLQGNPVLQTAWDRGRFLQKVRDLAGITITVSQAAKELGMTGIELRQLLDTDPEVAEIWDMERRRLRRIAAQAVIKNAQSGSKSAARYVENFLRSERTEPGEDFDFRRVPINVMVEITGKTRQTLHVWYHDQGCPRNPDCTYNLADFFHWIQCRTSLKRPRYSPDVVFEIRKEVREAVRELGGGSLAASRASEPA